MEQRNGFTLVELLSVIAIIVLLVSIFLPSLQNVKRQANSICCQYNPRNDISFSPVELILVSPDYSYVLNLWICDNRCVSDTCWLRHCWISNTCINQSEDNAKWILTDSLVNKIDQQQSAR